MSISISVDWRGPRKLKKRLDKLAQHAPDDLRAALREEGEAIMEISKSRVPVFQHEILNSAFVRTEGAELFLGYTAPHAVYQHEGVRGGFFPPPDRFRAWAAQKLGDENLAFAVARAVGERGLEPNKFLEGPIKERLPGMAKRIAKRVNDRMRGTV